MTVPYPFTNKYTSPNRSPRQNVARKGVVLHHAAGTNYASLHNMMMGAKQVSATGGCKDARIDLYVPSDSDRPWSLSSAWGDSSFRSVETANESTNGWTISDASHWSLARAVAYWAERDGFYPHRNGPQNTWTVIGHREVYTIYDESYATACPGGMDLSLVTAWSQQILKGSDPSGGGTKPLPVETPWEQYEKETDMLTMIMANDAKADPKVRYALTGPGYWRVIVGAAAANSTATRFGNAANVSWSDWDAAYAAAVSSGFVPASGQTSRTI